eukprot:364062-Chlamydomonas_euryale.AAC.3
MRALASQGLACSSDTATSPGTIALTRASDALRPKRVDRREGIAASSTPAERNRESMRGRARPMGRAQERAAATATATARIREARRDRRRRERENT